jgi:hypothetical protein
MHLAIDDPGFWGQCPADYLQPLITRSDRDGVPLSIFAMGDPHDPDSPAFAVFKMGPGQILPRHSHPCQRFEVIVQGSMEVQSPEEGGMWLKTGDVMLASPDELYGPHMAGPDGFTVVEYFSRLAGLYDITLETRRGLWHRDLLDEMTPPADESTPR